MGLPATDWEKELPFLDWITDKNNEPCVKLGFDGEKFGALCKDGSVIREGTDDRLKAYERFKSDQFKIEIQTTKDRIFDGFEHIRSADDPFPIQWMLERPRFIRWLEGFDDRYSPTIAEMQMAAAYADRKRRQREKGSLEPDGTANVKNEFSYCANAIADFIQQCGLDDGHKVSRLAQRLNKAAKSLGAKRPIVQSSAYHLNEKTGELVEETHVTIFDPDSENQAGLSEPEVNHDRFPNYPSHEERKLAVIGHLRTWAANVQRGIMGHHFVVENKKGDSTAVQGVTAASLPPSQRKAYFAFEYAARKLAKSADDLTAPQAWTYLREHGFDEDGNELEGYELPSKDTFATTLSRARSAMGELKNQKRVGRASRSAVDVSGQQTT